jgi:BolA protein
MKRTDLIKSRLQESLNPQHLELVNESAKHRGHAGDDDSGESHFKLKVVSSRFEGLGRIDRHRLVHQVLGQELNSAIHALSITALTPAEHK